MSLVVWEYKMKPLATLISFLGLLSTGFGMNTKVAILSTADYGTGMVNGKKATPFTPTNAEVQKAEEKLAEYLKAKYPKLAEKYSAYYRQYGGLEIQGEKKIIRGNFMCRIFDSSWKSQWVHVDDGGDCFFNFMYDLKTNEIIQFMVNGYA